MTDRRDRSRRFAAVGASLALTAALVFVPSTANAAQQVFAGQNNCAGSVSFLRSLSAGETIHFRATIGVASWNNGPFYYWRKSNHPAVTPNLYIYAGINVSSWTKGCGEGP